MTRLLVLDTATETLHLGLADGAQRWTLAVPGGARASAALLPAVMDLLTQAGVPLRALDAIGFGRGPGAFTGVRAACAIAQGLAFGAERPVLALDTLMAVAEDARQQGAGSSLWVAVDARMEQVYAAHFEHAQGAWRCVSPPALHSPAALAAELTAKADGRVEVAGNSLTVHAETWQGWDGGRWPQAVPSGAALLALAQVAWARGERLDAAEALPLYVRDNVARTTAERAADRAAAA